MKMTKLINEEKREKRWEEQKRLKKEPTWREIIWVLEHLNKIWEKDTDLKYMLKRYKEGIKHEKEN